MKIKNNSKKQNIIKNKTNVYSNKDVPNISKVKQKDYNFDKINTINNNININRTVISKDTIDIKSLDSKDLKEFNKKRLK